MALLGSSAVFQTLAARSATVTNFEKQAQYSNPPQSFCGRPRIQYNVFGRQCGALTVSVPKRAVITCESTAEGGETREGGCPGCGQPSVVGGCNGEGRIQGGLGAVPLFSWWPIKAYRPCPEFVKAGGNYRRTGQSLDEVAFGRKGRSDDLNIEERLKGKQ
eukprot:TRINITY_DN8542_c0_g1_i1.p1 TRINITY_DN8542_c0_g1~~TRINITY_DN8542_c0_g1_i1.p1  ORF type:complete len:161 (-),score=12.88 TRINITY_DN8542_c0_g1_i1:589-1071(-)